MLRCRFFQRCHRLLVLAAATTTVSVTQRSESFSTAAWKEETRKAEARWRIGRCKTPLAGGSYILENFSTGPVDSIDYKIAGL